MRSFHREFFHDREPRGRWGCYVFKKHKREDVVDGAVCRADGIYSGDGDVRDFTICVKSLRPVC